jgi:hypothetical protein
MGTSTKSKWEASGMPSGRAASRHCFCISSDRRGVVLAVPDDWRHSLGG